MFSRIRFHVVVAVVLFGCASASRADVLFFTNAGDFQSKLNELGIQDQNVLFNGSGVVSGPALTVTGITNQSGELVNITSSEKLTGLGGQSPAVKAQDGSFPGATIAFQNSNTFIRSLFFNLDNISSVSSSVVQLTVADQFGNFSNIVDNGNNFFGVIAFNGQALISANVTVLSSPSGLDVLDQLNLIRISSVQGALGEPVADAIPEPHSWMVWGLCVFALAAFVARRSMGQPVPA